MLLESTPLPAAEFDAQERASVARYLVLRGEPIRTPLYWAYQSSITALVPVLPDSIIFSHVRELVAASMPGARIQLVSQWQDLCLWNTFISMLPATPVTTVFCGTSDSASYASQRAYRYMHSDGSVHYQVLVAMCRLGAVCDCAFDTSVSRIVIAPGRPHVYADSFYSRYAIDSAYCSVWGLSSSSQLYATHIVDYVL